MNTLLQYLHEHALELFGVATGLWSVWLTVRENIWLWPIGIVSCIAYGVLFWQIKLYADMGLQVFFIAASVYGWYWWLHGGSNQTEAPISRLSLQSVVGLTFITVLAIVIVGYFFKTHTDAHLPFWDATASGASVTAQLLLMRKKIENWPLWIAIDVLYVGIYIYKQVYPTAALYVVFLILAALGWSEWNKTLKNQTLQLPITV